MDNVGDWLYIVFLVIAGISSLFGSKDKKKKNHSEVLGQPEGEIVSDTSSTTGKRFWEILEEMSKETTPEPNSSHPRPKKDKRPQKAPNPFLTNEQTIPDQIDSSRSRPATPITEEPGIMPEESFRDLDELKRAIIYTEILNRKY